MEKNFLRSFFLLLPRKNQCVSLGVVFFSFELSVIVFFAQ